MLHHLTKISFLGIDHVITWYCESGHLNFQKAAAFILKGIQKSGHTYSKGILKKAAAPILKGFSKKRPPAVLSLRVRCAGRLPLY